MNTTKLFEMEFNIPSPLVIEDVITFNRSYKKNIKEFVDFFSKLVGKPVNLVTKRINNSGYTLKRYDHYTLLSISEREGIYLKKINDGEGENPNIFISFNNILGEIPIIPKYTHSDLWGVGYSFSKLKEQYDELHRIVSLGVFGSTGIHLEYQYDEKSKNFSKFPYLIKGNLKKINLSNIEFFHCLTWGGELKNEEGYSGYNYVDMVPRNDTIRFLGPDRVLKKITIFNHRMNINPYDED
jgi:hypothetical protein